VNAETRWRFDAKMYFMFRYGARGVWVTLYVLPWGAAATASRGFRAVSDWAITSKSQHGGGQAVDTAELPAWSAVDTKDFDFVLG
jgi:hypothetical protein